jgi:hypothetical protein
MGILGTKWIVGHVSVLLLSLVRIHYTLIMLSCEAARWAFFLDLNQPLQVSVMIWGNTTRRGIDRVKCL